MGKCTLFIKKVLKKFYMRFYLFFILKTLKIKVRIAKTPEELKDVFRLRYKIYLESGYIKDLNFDEPLFSDKYDVNSINFIAYRKEHPVGVVRLVLNSNLGMPLEEYYNVDLSQKNGAVEVSRLGVVREYRGGKRRVVIALMRAVYYWSHKNNVRYWYMFMPEKLAESFEALCARFYYIPEKALTEKHTSARKLMLGYFRKTKAKPYILDVQELTKEMHRLKIYW